MNNEYIFTIDVNDRPGNKKLDQFEGRVERLNKNEVKLQIDVEGLDREKLLDYKKLAASVDPKMTIQMEYEYDKKSIDVMRKDISNLGELKLYVEKGNAAAVEQYIKQTTERISKGIQSGVNPNELIKDYKFAVDVISQYFDSHQIDPVSDKVFEKLEKAAQEIQGFKTYSPDTKNTLDTIISNRVKEYESMISDFKSDMERLSKMGAVEFSGEPIDGSKIKEYIKDYVRLIKLSGELKKVNLDSQISTVDDNAALEEKAAAIKGIAEEAKITAEEIDKVNKAIANGDTSKELKEHLGLLQNLYERQLKAYNDLFPSDPSRKESFIKNFLPDDWQSWGINDDKFNAATKEMAAEFRRNIGHALQEATGNLGEDLIKSLGIDKLRFDPGAIFGDEMEDFYDRLFNASIKTGKAVDDAAKQAKESWEKANESEKQAGDTADKHTKKIEKQTQTVEELCSKIERLRQLQNTVNNIDIAPAFGEDDSARLARIDQLAQQYFQTLKEINDVEKSGASKEVIQERIGLLSTLASKQMEAINASVPTGVDRNEYLKSAVNFDFGSDDAINSFNKVKKAAKEFSDNIQHDFVNNINTATTRFGMTDLSNIFNSAKAHTSAFDELGDIMDRINNASREMSQGVEEATDSLKNKEEAVESTVNAEKEEEQVIQSGIEATNEKTEADKKAAQAAEEKAQAEKESAEATRQSAEEQDKAKQEAEELARDEQEALDKTKQAIDEKTQAESEVADKSKQAAEQQIQAEQEIAGATRKAAEEQEKAAQTTIEAAEKKIEAEKEVTEEIRRAAEEQKQLQEQQSQAGDEQKKVDALKEEKELQEGVGDAAKTAGEVASSASAESTEAIEKQKKAVEELVAEYTKLEEMRRGISTYGLDGLDSGTNRKKGEYIDQLNFQYKKVIDTIESLSKEEGNTEGLKDRLTMLEAYKSSLIYAFDRTLPYSVISQQEDADNWLKKNTGKSYEDLQIAKDSYLYDGFSIPLSLIDLDKKAKSIGINDLSDLLPDDAYIDANGYKRFVSMFEDIANAAKDATERVEGLFFVIKRSYSETKDQWLPQMPDDYWGFYTEDKLGELLKDAKYGDYGEWKGRTVKGKTNHYEIMNKYGEFYRDSMTIDDYAKDLAEYDPSEDIEKLEKEWDAMRKNQQSHEESTSTLDSEAGFREKLSDQIKEQTAVTEGETSASQENKAEHESAESSQQEETDSRQKLGDEIKDQAQSTEADTNAIKENQAEHSKTADSLKEEGSARDTNADKIKEGTAAIEADTTAADENAKAHKEMQDVKEQGGTKTPSTGEGLTGADSNALNELVTALGKIVSSAADATAKKDELAAVERTLATDTGVSIVRLNAETGALDSVRRAADEAARAKERFISSNQTLANQTRDSSEALNKEATELKEVAAATQVKAVASKTATGKVSPTVDKDAVFTAYDSYESKGAATYDTDRYNKITAALAADNPDYNKIAKLIETGNDAVDAAIRKREDLEARLAKANERIKALEAKGIATFDADSYAKLQKSLDKVDTSATKQTVTALENAITQAEKDYEKTYRELYDSTLKRYEEMQQNEFYQKSDKLSGLAAKLKVSPNDGGMLNEFIQELDVVKKKIEESESLLISYRHVLEDGLNLSNVINGDSHLTEKFKPQLDQLEEQLGSMELNPELVTKAFEAVKDLSQSVDNELTQLGSSVVSIMAEIDSLTKQRSEYMKNVKLLGSAKSSDDPNYADIAASVEQYESRLKTVREAVAGINRMWDENNEIVKKANTALNDYENNIKNISRTDITKNAQGMIDSIDRALKQKGSGGLTKAYTDQLDELKGKMQEAIRYVNNLGDQPIDTSKVRAFFSAFEEGKVTIKGVSDQINKLATQSQLESLLSKINDDIAKGANSGVLGREYADLKAQVESAINEIKNCTDASEVLSKVDFQNFANLQKDLHNSAIESGALKGSMVSKMADAINNQSAQFLATYFSFQDIIRYTKEITNAVVQTDSALTELKKVSDESNERIQQSFKKSAETAQELGSTITSVIQSTSDWARLGFNIGEAEELAKASTMLQVVGDNMTQQSASESMVSTLKGFHMDASEAMDIVDKFNEVRLLAAPLCRIANKNRVQLNLLFILKLLGHPKANLPKWRRKSEKSSWMLYGEIKAFERMSYVA